VQTKTVVRVTTQEDQVEPDGGGLIPQEETRRDGVGLGLREQNPSDWACGAELRTRVFGRLTARPTPLWKRACDVVAAVGLLVILAPVLVLIGLYIGRVSRGPVLFRQSRMGLMGDDFTIYKFRTLHCSESATAEHRDFVAQLSAQDGVLTKPDLSKRLIPGGAFLRRTSLDELPQLWNILVGNMSLIGPRPDVLGWEDYKPHQLRRFEVVPGVTGLWQVSGKNRLTFEQMIAKDLEYVDRRSPLLDLKISLLTVRFLLQRDNN